MLCTLTYGIEICPKHDPLLGSEEHISSIVGKPEKEQHICWETICG